jgi:hypothetical protein
MRAKGMQTTKRFLEEEGDRSALGPTTKRERECSMKMEAAFQSRSSSDVACNSELLAIQGRNLNLFKNLSYF